MRTTSPEAGATRALASPRCVQRFLQLPIEEPYLAEEALGAVPEKAAAPVQAAAGTEASAGAGPGGAAATATADPMLCQLALLAAAVRACLVIGACGRDVGAGPGERGREVVLDAQPACAGRRPRIS